jgi:glutathione synthase/RimK-type ligase-like ATP-grasp enzyme
MLNSRDARRRPEIKALAHLAFEQNGIPQPPSFVVSAEGVGDREAAWEGETLVKPLYGNRGSGIESAKRSPLRLSGLARRVQILTGAGTTHHA